MDEEGDRWVHLLYRKYDDPWAARLGVGEEGHKRHDHFDRLQLGLNVDASFIEDVTLAKEKDLGMVAPVPSASATAGKKAPGSTKVGGEEEDDHEFRMRPSGSNSNNSSSSSRQAEGKAGAGKKSKAKIGSKVGVKRPTERQPAESKGHKAGGAPGKQRSWLVRRGSARRGGHQGRGEVPKRKARGSFATMSQNEKEVVAAMKKIPELEYRRAYLLSIKRRARGLKVGGSKRRR
ncbi:unnamed protein product [Ectocarpus sp. CCAP 1310/34]|nr:unnamed protein product [Ectocarpus sp. CCAP 1310/34]